MLKILATALLFLATTGLVMADNRHGHHPPPPTHGGNHARPAGVHPIHKGVPHVAVRNYHLQHGHRFRGGWYYEGWRHNHWSKTIWDNRYGAYLYFDPGTTAWYYWCAPHYRFYPVTYVPLATYAFPYVAEPVAPVVPVPPPPPDGGPGN